MQLEYFTSLYKRLTLIICVASSLYCCAVDNLFGKDELSFSVEVVAESLTQWTMDALAIEKQDHKKQYNELQNNVFVLYLQLVRKIKNSGWSVVVGDSKDSNFLTSAQADFCSHQVNIQLPTVKRLNERGLHVSVAQRIFSVLLELHNSLQADKSQNLDSRASDNKISEDEFVRSYLLVEINSYIKTLELMIGEISEQVRISDAKGMDFYESEWRLLRGRKNDELVVEFMKSDHAKHYRNAYRKIKLRKQEQSEKINKRNEFEHMHPPTHE